MMADQRVLSASLLLGFPYADVREMGTSVLVVTDDDPDLARALADDFAEYLRHRRSAFVGQLIEVEAAVAQAVRGSAPTCLLDMGDNIGGGAPGDGTVLLKALIDAGVSSAFVCLHDPAAVAAAEKVGRGKSTSLSLGGNGPTNAGTPIATKAKVLGLFDGKFTESEARHGGRTEYSMGRTAVVQLPGGQTVMLTTDRIAPFSLGQLTSCGLDPKSFKAIVAKGVHAPVAAYRSVCPTMIRVNTPGITTADLTQLDYHRRRKPLFPLEAI